MHGSAVLVCAATCAVLLSGCDWFAGHQQHADPPVELVIDWHVTGEREVPLFPAYLLTGALMSKESLEDPDRLREEHAAKTIDGRQYMGSKCYLKEDTDEEDQETLVFEVLMRRLGDDGAPIDIRLSSTVKCRVDLKDFEGGTLRDAESKQVLARPALLSPGKYHLEAVME
jgi:hypothetical protein